MDRGSLRFGWVIISQKVVQTTPDRVLGDKSSIVVILFQFSEMERLLSNLLLSVNRQSLIS